MKFLVVVTPPYIYQRSNIDEHPLIFCDDSLIEHKMGANIVSLSNELGSESLAFNLAIDSNKVSQDKKYYKSIRQSLEVVTTTISLLFMVFQMRNQRKRYSRNQIIFICM